MAFQDLPLVPSVASYRFGVALNENQYIIDVHWNSREEAWYLDWYKEDDTVIAIGLKVVLGAYLGRTKTVPPFSEGSLVAVDTSGESIEATFDDLGSRVIVRYIPVEDLIPLRDQVGE